MSAPDAAVIDRMIKAATGFPVSDVAEVAAEQRRKMLAACDVLPPVHLNVSGRSVYAAVRNLVVNEFGIDKDAILAMAGEKVAAVISGVTITSEITGRVSSTVVDIAARMVSQEARSILGTMRDEMRSAIATRAGEFMASDWAKQIATEAIERIVTASIPAAVRAEVAAAIANRITVTIEAP